MSLYQHVPVYHNLPCLPIPIPLSVRATGNRGIKGVIGGRRQRCQANALLLKNDRIGGQVDRFILLLFYFNFYIFIHFWLSCWLVSLCFS